MKLPDASPTRPLVIHPEVTDETSSLLGSSLVDALQPSQVQVEVTWTASVNALDHTHPRLFLMHRTGRREERVSSGTTGFGGKLLNLGKQAGSLAGHLLSGGTSSSPRGSQPVKGDHICLLRVRVAEPGLDAVTSTWLVTSVWELSGIDSSLDIVSSTAFCLGPNGSQIGAASGLFTPIPSPSAADYALGNQRFLASGHFHWMRGRSRGGHGLKMYHQV